MRGRAGLGLAGERDQSIYTPTDLGAHSHRTGGTGHSWIKRSRPKLASCTVTTASTPFDNMTLNRTAHEAHRTAHGAHQTAHGAHRTAVRAHQTAASALQTAVRAHQAAKTMSGGGASWPNR
ncbi:hypothetical protein E2P81_ATG02761 [Venturia nashicola]|nr:hypothetical protein E2P81_ATG02761 [Venturia nashicola]